MDAGRAVGFKVLDYSTYDPYDEEQEAAWSGPRFHVPQLGLREATANEIVLATRALYGTENSVNRDYFGAAANESGEEALALWLGCLQAGDSMAHFALGYTLLELGRTHEAYRHLRYYTDIAPGIAWSWAYRGRAAAAVGFVEGAAELRHRARARRRGRDERRPRLSGARLTYLGCSPPCRGRQHGGGGDGGLEHHPGSGAVGPGASRQSG